MWTTYDVLWTFLSPLCGQTPGRSGLIEGWVNARKAKRAIKPDARSLQEIAEEVLTTLPPEEEDEPITLVFQRHPETKELVMRGATIRAHLKDCAYQITSYHTGRTVGKGEKSFDTRWKNCVYLAPEAYWIPILSEGRPMYEPTGLREKPIHIRTPQGPRHTIKAFEYLEAPSLTMAFQLRVLRTHAGKDTISRENIEMVMMYGGTHGYAGERSEDGGRYYFTLTERPEKDAKEIHHGG